MNTRGNMLWPINTFSGSQWTDHNPHDPGITILEQLSYALADLHYRIDHPIPDLLASTPNAAPLPGPTQALTCAPITRADLRRVALGAHTEVEDAWIEAPPAAEASVYHRATWHLPQTGGLATPKLHQEIWLAADPLDFGVRPITLRGLHRILVQAPTSRLDAVCRALHSERPLGEDFTVQAAQSLRVTVDATVEIGPNAEPAILDAAIREALAACIRPRVRFESLAEALSRRKVGLDELLEGPWSKRGVPREDGAERSRTARQRAIRKSDLLHAVMDLQPAVRAVTSLDFKAEGSTEPASWVLKIREGYYPILSPTSKIILVREGLEVTSRSLVTAGERLAESPQADGRRPDSNQGLSSTLGRDRHVARYEPLLAYLPAVYRASEEWQRKQLAGYLRFFDQLLANELAQLAEVGTLLSPTSKPKSEPQTYFTQPVGDELQLLESNAPPAAEAQPQPYQRRLRFLDHLLARFGERVADHAYVVAGKSDPMELIEAREALLGDIAELGRARGTGYDILTGSPGGFERRLRAKLRLGEGDLLVIEHILLRPLAEDHSEGIPFLSDCESEDPWSLQVTVVIKGEENGKSASSAEETVFAEAPAHLKVKVLWRNDATTTPTFGRISTAWAEFVEEYAAYRGGAPVDLPGLRSHRSAILDYLELGNARPVVRVSVTNELVDHGAATQVTVSPTRETHTYRVWRRPVGDDEYVFGAAAPGETIALCNGEVEVRVQRPTGLESCMEFGQPCLGNGAAISVQTPALEEDSIFVVTASRDDQTFMLDSMCLVLVKPRVKGLTFSANWTGHELVIDGTGLEQGVFYEFSKGLASPPFRIMCEGKPGRGIGAVRIGVDFVVSPVPTTTVSNVRSGDVLEIRARRLLSGVGADAGRITVP